MEREDGLETTHRTGVAVHEPPRGSRVALVHDNSLHDSLHSLDASASQKLYERVVGPDGRPRADIYIAVNDVDVRLLSGLLTPVKKEDVVFLLAYIHPG